MSIENAPQVDENPLEEDALIDENPLEEDALIDENPPEEGMFMKIKHEIAKRLLNHLAEKGTKEAEEKLNPLRKWGDQDYNRFVGKRQELYQDLKNLLEGPRFSVSHTSPEEKIEKFVNKSEKLKGNIRKENIDAYMALRKARKFAKTPEEEQRLKDLLSRQNAVREALLKPEAKDSLGVFKDFIERDIERIQAGMNSSNITSLDSDLVKVAAQSGLNRELIRELRMAELERELKTASRIMRAIQAIEGDKEQAAA